MPWFFKRGWWCGTLICVLTWRCWAVPFGVMFLPNVSVWVQWEVCLMEVCMKSMWKQEKGLFKVPSNFTILWQQSSNCLVPHLQIGHKCHLTLLAYWNLKTNQNAFRIQGEKFSIMTPELCSNRIHSKINTAQGRLIWNFFWVTS